jgi:hypothetical protein
VATIKTSDADVQLFLGTDPYRADVDNRPLRNLISNDIEINNELVAVKTEVENARTDDSTGVPVIYSSLDARLEAMSTGNSGNASVSYSIFQAQADRNRALYQSGWLIAPSTKEFGTTFAGDDFGALMGTQWRGIKTRPNSLHINLDYANNQIPLPLLVNGWLIKLSKMQAGGGTTYSDHVVVKLPDAPASGGRQDFVFLEVWLREVSATNPVFWLYGSPQYRAAEYGEGTPVENGNFTKNPLDPRVVHTLSRLPNGNWMQVQHRIRIVSDISTGTAVGDSAAADGFGGSNAAKTLARGPQANPVASKNFTNMLHEMADAGLWRAGNGSGDMATLGTVDGYTYAIPIAMVHRRSTEEFTMATQNGSKVVGNANSGTMASDLSGRPDRKFFDSITRDDYIDMRHAVDSYTLEFERLMQRAFNEVLRGTTRLQWQQLKYTAGTQPVFGNRLLTNETVFSDAVYPNYASDPSLGSNTNYVKDKIAGTFSRPDGVRSVFASYAVPQRISFVFNPFTNTATFPIAGFATATSNGTSRTITINPAVLSGGSGNSVAAGVPTWSWIDDGDPITPVRASATTFTMSVGSRSTGTVLCNVDILFPSKSGTDSLPSEVVRQEFFDGTNSHSSWSSVENSPQQPFEVVKDTQNRLWVAEYYGSRVSVWTEDSSGAMTRTHVLAAATIVGGAANAFSYVNSVAVHGNPLGGAASGSVYVSDFLNKRVRRYTYDTGTTAWTLTNTISSFTVASVNQTFGNPSGPHGLAVTSNGATLYVSDSNRHVVFAFATSNFGSATIFAGALDSHGNNASGTPIKLRNPTKLTMNGTDVWVVDSTNRRVLLFDSSGALQGMLGAESATITSVTEGEPIGGGALDARITNPDVIRIIGTPGTTNVKYLVAGGHGLNATNQNRIFRLDHQFNVEAVSSGFASASQNLWPAAQQGTRIGGFDVDSTSAPNLVYVGMMGPAGLATDAGFAVLQYSNLAVVNRSTQGLGRIIWPRYIPASGGANAAILAVVHNDNGFNIYRFSLDANGYVWSASAQGLPTNINGPVVMSQFTAPKNVAGIGWCFYEAITTIDKVTRVVRWTPNGQVWQRVPHGSGNKDILLTLDGVGTPYNVELSSDGHLFMAFPGMTDFPGYSHVVGRFKWDGSAFISPGETGNSPGMWGTNGAPGSSKDNVATPTGLHLSTDGTRLGVVSKSTKPWEVFYDANNDGVVNSFDQIDPGRLVLLDTTSAKWESGAQSPYMSDTVNQTTTFPSNMSGTPHAVAVSGDDLFITNAHTINHYKRLVTGNNRSYSWVGRFGVDGEPGADHAHVNGPYGIIISPLNSNRLIVADAFSNRLLSIHRKMAGVSLASGNIETLNPLVSNERLRIWHNTIAYQGVGAKTFPENSREAIAFNQVLASSEFLYITSLGRSPVPAGVATALLSAIDRLPLTKLGGINSSAFNSAPIAIDGINVASPFLKLPILTHGLSTVPTMDGLSEDSWIAYIRTDANLTPTYAERGFVSNISSVATPHSITNSAKDASAPRLVIQPYLIKRSGKVFLCIITSTMLTGDATNDIGRPGHPYNHSIDLFEVPGRLLLR